MNKKYTILKITLITITFFLILDAVVGKYLYKKFIRKNFRDVDNSYAIKSDIFHHNFLANFKGLAGWGNVRYDFCTDGNGFRDNCSNQFNEIKEFDIGFIGDSFTEGLGVEYENSFVGIIENKITSEFDNFTVLNAGLSTYSPIIYLSKLNYLIKKKIPITKVFVVICGGDLYDDGKSLNSKIFTYKKSDELFFGGVHRSDLKKYKINDIDILPYIPIEEENLNKFDLDVLVLPYFLNYNPQENFYYAVENTDFEVNPEGRTDGTYTKYQSLDDKIDGLHHYTWFIKAGRGRATEDAALEVRNNIITRDEAVALVKQYDGEFPQRYFKDTLKYLSISEKEFFETIDKFRSPHLWEKRKDKWFLKKAVWMLNK